MSELSRENQVAAKWWADQLRSKPKHDNGDPVHNVMFTMVTRNMESVDESKIKLFEKSLFDRLEKLGDRGCYVGVDYGPDMILAESAEDAGIETGYRFPVKTSMWINKGKVSVSCGYRAPIEIIYGAE